MNVLRLLACLVRGHDWRWTTPINAKHGDSRWACAHCGMEWK